jgi:hypothetical protein
MSFGIYSLMNVNWGLVRFVVTVGGIAVFGSTFAASRLSR